MREWNNCFIKNAHKISKILPDFICKNSRFSAGFKFRADAYSYHIWRVWYNGSYRVFSHDVMAAILVSQNNETAAMLVSQTSPVGVELLSYANAFFCSYKFAWTLAT